MNLIELLQTISHSSYKRYTIGRNAHKIITKVDDISTGFPKRTDTIDIEDVNVNESIDLYHRIKKYFNDLHFEYEVIGNHASSWGGGYTGYETNIFNLERKVWIILQFDELKDAAD